MAKIPGAKASFANVIGDLVERSAGKIEGETA
jgi:hypothetical protein